MTHSRSLHLSALLLPLTAGLLVGCTGVTPPATTISAAQGGQVSLSSGAAIDIPASSLSADSAVTLEAQTGTLPALTGKTLVPGSAHRISAGSGVTMNAGTLALPFSPSAVGSLGLNPLKSGVSAQQSSAQAALSSLQLYQLVNQAWVLVQGNPNIDPSGLFRQLISSLGTYALFAPTSSPAAPTLARVSLTCVGSSVAVGASVTCTARGLDASGSEVSPQPTFAFSSSETGKATVTQAGVVTGVAAGSTNITASAGGLTSAPVTVTVTASSSGGAAGVVYDGPTFSPAIGANGEVFYGRYDFSNPSAGLPFLFMLNVGGKEQRLPMPNTTDSLTLPQPCVAPNGSVAFRVSRRVNNKTTYVPLYFDRAANTVTEIPLPTDWTKDDDLWRFGCQDGKVMGSTSTGGSRSAKSFLWTPGQATPAPLPTYTPQGSCIGCSAVALNKSGSVLYTDALLTGSTFTPITVAAKAGSGSIFAGLLTDSGEVYGTVGYNPLFRWTPAGSTLLGAPATGYPETYLRLAGVNSAGDVVLQADSAGGSNTFSFWLYRAGTWTELKAPAGYEIARGGVVGISDSGLVLLDVYATATLQRRLITIKP